ncbi:MAG: hypothetical protein JKY59_10270, partial [Emcibacter sp.]|nr:hypothetical protein [Emcibacter sp.]
SLSLTYKYEKDIAEGTSLSELVAPYDLVIFDAVSGRQAADIFTRFEGVVTGDKRFISIKNAEPNKLTHGLTEPEITALHGYYRMAVLKTSNVWWPIYKGKLLAQAQITFCRRLFFQKPGFIIRPMTV